MKKTILFLGAGMSATFGYPLTAAILPRIIERINAGTLFNDHAADKKIAALYRRLLKELLVALSPGISHVFEKGNQGLPGAGNIPLVTDLLSQLEHLVNSGHAIIDWNFELDGLELLPKQVTDRWELSNLKTLFDWAIINVINDSKPVISKDVNTYLKWIRKVNKAGKQFVSIISTNYDVAFERELLTDDHVWDADKYADFGVSWRDPVIKEGPVYNRPNDPLYRIFKLHGSTDWLKCRRCGFLYINPTNDIYDLTFNNQKQSANMCHCGYWPLQPVLVTMSYSRKMEEPNLHEIWRNCFEELRTADEWIIVGYSLPGEDFDIRSLFLRALAGNNKKPKIIVVQKTENSKPRYDMFFGEGKYEFIAGGFENYAATFS